MRRNDPHCQGHGHPKLKRPVSRERIREELADLYHQAGFKGPVDLEWEAGLRRTHDRNQRRYAQVAPYTHPPHFELAPQTVYIPGPNRRGLLAHEVGHVLDPEGTEDEADSAAYKALGIKIGYDRRWPGKGLQRARRRERRNPDEGIRELERAWVGSGTYEDMAQYVIALERGGELGAAAQVLEAQASVSDHKTAARLGGQARLYRLLSLSPRDRARADALHEEILAWLDTANGRRRERIEDALDAWRAIRDAAGPARWGGGVSGTVGGSYGWTAWTSATLAARPPRSRSVYFGVGVTWARGASLGRVWYVLQPWMHDPDSDPQLWSKLTAWCARAANVKIPNRLVQPVLDLLLEHYQRGAHRLEDLGHWIGEWRDLGKF